jgi:hypothetical protein
MLLLGDKAGEQLPEREILAAELAEVLGQRPRGQVPRRPHYLPWQSADQYPASSTRSTEIARRERMRENSRVETEPPFPVYLFVYSFNAIGGQVMGRQFGWTYFSCIPISS